VFEGWKIFINAFSLKTTGKDLLALPKAVAAGQLSCVHGIRVGSLLWMLLGHTYQFHNSWPVNNYLSSGSQVKYIMIFSKKSDFLFFKIVEKWTAAPVLNAYLSVDSFFFLGGLLTAYVPLMELKKGRKFNIFKYYIYRYLRYTIFLCL
jgi:hypothetical protein